MNKDDAFEYLDKVQARCDECKEMFANYQPYKLSRMGCDKHRQLLQELNVAQTALIPAKLARLTFEDITQVDKNVMSKIRIYMMDPMRNRYVGAGLFLYGPNGTGKSLLASLILRKVCTTRNPNCGTFYSGYFITASDANKAEGELVEPTIVEIQRKIRTVDFLVIDDLDKIYKKGGVVNDWTAMNILNLLKRRNDNNLCTIITSNKSDIDKSQDDIIRKSIESISKQMFDYVEINGNDFRIARGNGLYNDKIFETLAAIKKEFDVLDSSVYHAKKVGNITEKDGRFIVSAELVQRWSKKQESK